MTINEEYTDKLEVGLGRLTALEYEVETRTLDFARKFDAVSDRIERYVAQFATIVNDLESRQTIADDRVDGIFEVAAEQHMFSHEDRLTRLEGHMAAIHDENRKVAALVKTVQTEQPQEEVKPLASHQEVVDAMRNLGYKIVATGGTGMANDRWYLDIEPA